MLTIKIETGNAAFADDPGELARILRALADRLDDFDPQRYESGVIRDVNGNRVGSFRAD